MTQSQQTNDLQSQQISSFSGSVEIATTVEEYLQQQDWRVKANANQGYSLGGLILNISGKVVANYWLNHLYPPDIGKAHRVGDFHIHDLDMLSGYCCGWSLRQLLFEGFNGVAGKVEATPPKHLSSAIGQIVNFLGTLQNEWAGAQALSSFDTYLAPFVRKDQLNYQQVKQCIQELIYNLNVPSRWGCVPLDTEILTQKGWKLKDELREGEKIYGFQAGQVIEDELIRINEYDFDGDLVCLSSHALEQFLTPEHRVLMYDEAEQVFAVDLAKNLFDYLNPIKVPVSGHVRKAEMDLSDEMIQLYAWLSSQRILHEQEVVLVLKNKEACAQFEPLLLRLGISYRKTAYGSQGAHYRFSRSFSKHRAMILSKKGLPMNLLRQCSARQIKLFIHTYVQEGKKPLRLITSEEQIKDDFQELAVLAGYQTEVSEHQHATKGILYTLVFSARERVTLSGKKRVPYQGKVWCPTTRSTYWVARRGGNVFITGNSQTPFTNLTFDWVCPEDLRAQIPVIAGEEMPFSYGELQEEMDLINRAFIEVMTEGDAKGRIFTFPIPTYNMTTDFPWESQNSDLLFQMTAKYGLPYFQNFVNSELEPHMVRSMCCRLQLDLRELLKRGNGLFGSSESTGSIGVVTINCARLGYLFRGDEEGLYQRLDTLLELAKESLEIKRQVIQQYMGQGLFPFSKRYLGTLRNHFSTIGVNGLHEMIRNFKNDQEDITTPWGQTFALRFLDHIRAKIVEFQEHTGHLYNLEATPAEGTTYRFAKEDKKRYPDILQSGTAERPYYTNSSQLPVGFTQDPFEALEYQNELQKKYTGGTVIHLYMNEQISSAQACKTLVRRILERFEVPYITITPVFSICPVHGYLPGEQPFCPHCDEEILAKKRNNQ